MSCIDFSFDSRIRKKYVPLIHQQRYLRHVRRIAARNLAIPKDALSLLLEQEVNREGSKQRFEDTTSELVVEEDVGGGVGDVGVGISVGVGDEADRSSTTSTEAEEDEAVLCSRLHLGFYFTLHRPWSSDCDHSGHHCQCNQLLYCSESLTSTNPSWKTFEGSSLCSPSISHFVIRVFYVCRQSSTKRPASSQSSNVPPNCSATIKKKGAFEEDTESQRSGSLFLEWEIHLSGLLYIGEEFPKDRRLTQNAIIFGLPEGFYTSVCSVKSEELLRHLLPPSQSIPVRDVTMVRNSYCLNTLIRIQMFQNIIQATAAKVNLARIELEARIERARLRRKLTIKVEKMQTSLDFLTTVIENRRKKLVVSSSRVAQLENEVFEHNTEMSSRLQILKDEISLVNEFKSIRLLELSRRLDYLRNCIVHRRRLLARELFDDVYPIVPFPGASGYSIRGIFLPSADQVDQHQHKMISIALGYVTHLVYILASLLDLYLYHPLITNGSRSTIVDLYNKVLRPNEKILPLYAKSKSALSHVLFKHGLYLLNRTVIFLRHSCGLESRSLATTLANLHGLFMDCLLLPDYDLSTDESLYRINPFSPFIDPKMLRLTDSGHHSSLSDINIIKDKDSMIDSLWKEVEQLTLGLGNHDQPPPSSFHARTHSRRLSVSSLATTTVSTSSGSLLPPANSPFVEEVREVISKQRQNRRRVSSQLLSQLSSSSSSYVSTTSSWTAQRPTTSSATSSAIDLRPGNYHHHHRVGSNGSSEIDMMFSTSPSRFTTFQQFNSLKRIRSVSGYVGGLMPQSMPSTTSSFLHPHYHEGESCSPVGQAFSVSLDKGLNLVESSELESSKSSSNSMVSALTDQTGDSNHRAELLQYEPDYDTAATTEATTNQAVVQIAPN